MAKLIRQSEALRRINELEEQAVAAGNLAGCGWLLKAWLAVMSCRIEKTEGDELDLPKLRMHPTEHGAGIQTEGRRDPAPAGVQPLWSPFYYHGKRDPDAQDQEKKI